MERGQEAKKVISLDDGLEDPEELMPAAMVIPVFMYCNISFSYNNSNYNNKRIEICYIEVLLYFLSLCATPFAKIVPLGEDFFCWRT